MPEEEIVEVCVCVMFALYMKITKKHSEYIYICHQLEIVLAKIDLLPLFSVC